MLLASVDVISKNQLNRSLASGSDKISGVEDAFLLYSRINDRC
jgi:hypothetical protein